MLSVSQCSDDFRLASLPVQIIAMQHDTEARQSSVELAAGMIASPGNAGGFEPKTASLAIILQLLPPIVACVLSGSPALAPSTA